MAAEDGDELQVEEIEATHEISVEVIAVLGKAIMPIQQLLRMGRGAVVELDTGTNDPVTLVVSGVPVAKGEVVIVDEHMGVQLSQRLRSAEW